MTCRRSTLVSACLACLILASAPAAHAGASIFAGVNFPTGDFNEGAKTGWALGGYYTWDLLPLVDVGATVAYNDFSLGLSGIPDLDEAFGTSFNAWEVEALGQVNVLIFKAFLGLGLANYTGIDADGSDKRKTKFAWQVGLAAEFFILEARLGYHQINTDASSPNWVALTLGLTF